MSKKISITGGLVLLTAIFFVLQYISETDGMQAQQTNYITENNATGTVVKIENTLITVDIVQTQEEREKGLSGRSALAENAGMFFVMDQSARHGFWMPDMHFAIDIIWLDENMKVVDVKKNATPESYPKVFRPIVPARYVLEVPTGFIDTHHIQIGSTAVLE